MTDGDRHVFEKTFFYEKNAVTVAASGGGDTTIAEIDVSGKKKLCFHMVNSTGAALNNFDALVKPTENASYVDITPANWAALAAAEYRFKYSNGNLAALATSGVGYFEMDVSGLHTVKLEGASVTNPTDITVKYALQ